MAVTSKKGGKNWYYTFKYTDPQTNKQKVKWINTGVPVERSSTRAKNEAQDIGRRMRAEFLDDLKRIQEGKRIYHKEHNIHSKYTISEYAEYWLREIRGSVEDSTLNAYEAPLRKHILPRIGDIVLEELDQYDLKEFINSEIAECDERQRAIDRLKSGADGKDVKVGSDKKPYYVSIRKHLKILHMMLNYAISEDDIFDNPVDKINPQVLRKIPKSDFESHPYTKKEIAKLREVIRGNHLEPVIIITSYLGLRREEVLGLRWQDIDFENQRIYIRNVCRLVGSKIEYKERTKTKASKAMMTMIAPLRDYLLELRSNQEEDKKLFGSGYYESDLVCRWNDGHPIKPNNVSQGYSRLLEKAGLRHTRFHDLRHTVGTIILEATGDLKIASTALRHSDIGITANTYINPRDEVIAKGFEAMDTSKVD